MAAVHLYIVLYVHFICYSSIWISSKSVTLNLKHSVCYF